MLGKDYFKGITSENIKQIYEEIISQKIIHCNYETFLQSRITDVDIKQDFIMLETNYETMLKTIKCSIKESHKNFIHSFTKKENRGIQIGNRTEKNHPFLKVYDKEQEIKNHSQFLEKELNFNVPLDIKRMEATFSTKLLRKFNVISEEQSATLECVLTGVENNSSDLFKKLFIHYLNPQLVGEVKMAVKSAGESKEVKLQRKVSSIVELCLGLAQSESETIQKVLSILEPNINYKALIVRLTKMECERQLKEAHLPGGLDFSFPNKNFDEVNPLKHY
jgi:hypothetical protein